MGGARSVCTPDWRVALQDRATDATFLGFQKYVLNFFQADLCAAVTDTHRDGSGAWRDTAKCVSADFWYVREDNFLYPGGIQAMYSKQRIWRLSLENGLEM